MHQVVSFDGKTELDFWESEEYDLKQTFFFWDALYTIIYA